MAEARIALKRATHPTNADPEVFEALYLLGEISEMQTDLEDAKKHFALALYLKPDFTRACRDIVRILQQQGRNGEVRQFLEDRVRLCAGNTEYRLMLAKACTDAFDFQGTVDNLLAAVELGVNETSVSMMLGAALCRLEREEDSRPFFEMAQATDPSVAHEILYHRAYYHTRNSGIDEAVECLEQSIRLQPDYFPSHSLLLLNLSHGALAVNRSYKHAAQRFAQIVESVHPPLPALPAQRDDSETKSFRVGFIAGEFVDHPVYHFLVGILEHIDKSSFHCVAFSNNQLDDTCTTTLKELFTEWHDIRHLSHAMVADLVREQQIDVLFDLSGHTGDARLPVFARKPAAVQVTWLGYFASTGLTTMDYIIADEACVPQDSTEWFSEKVVRLPATRLCMNVPRTSHPIDVTPAPCKANGNITFGSFQQAAKINRRVLQAWVDVMRAVPNSRLRIQNKALDSTSASAKFRDELNAAGIDLSRVDLVPATSWEAYLSAHSEVDVLLDTFPYPGGTTTAFALWMGVPTVTLEGTTMLSRQGSAMLACVGLQDWIAKNELEYVEIARRVALEPDMLVQIREQLRVRALASPLFDCKAFATNFQNAIRFMYQDKLAGGSIPPNR